MDCSVPRIQSLLNSLESLESLETLHQKSRSLETQNCRDFAIPKLDQSASEVDQKASDDVILCFDVKISILL